MSEPVLSEEDLRKWGQWERLCVAHARTREYAREIGRAEQAIREMAARCPGAYVAVSGGKDSMALWHLVTQRCAIPAGAMSVKDDLDYPGEREMVEATAAAWGVPIDVLTPPSLLDWLREHGDTADASDDMHGRRADLADRFFYRLLDDYREARGTPGVYLGLRAEESKGRAANAYARGAIYQKATGEVVCQPIWHWSAIDVFTYLLEHEIPIHPVYRCCRDAEHPGRIRKSWWVPGAHSRKGGMVWLRTYWPSLYRRLCQILPDARRWA